MASNPYHPSKNAPNQGGCGSAPVQPPRESGRPSDTKGGRGEPASAKQDKRGFTTPGTRGSRKA